ncbi:hypothetical protein EV363DRAFT_1214113 [Boletus edulis]|nr:hypothetical protein EV363DRAFT_1214113 [Boletus edulis]
MSRTAPRLFSSSSRYSARVSLNTATRAPRAALTRRMMSSESHAGHGSTSSDKPWIIGSALVFGPLFLYFVSPSARKGSHGHADHGHDIHSHDHEDKQAQQIESHREEDVKPMADDEGTEISGQEVKESMEKAFEFDSPKDAQEREEVVAKAEMTTVEKSTAEAEDQADSSTDATPESESHPTPVAPVGVDEATNATSDEKVQNAASDTGAAAVDSKA